MDSKKNITKQLKDIADTMPSAPGVYRFYDKNERIIYIGKAKNLKKRVLSYFTKKHESNKTYVLVKNIKKIEHFVTETEIDALLLENSMIKKHKPRYNVMLKDDKTYPWICIKNEQFPRVFYTRNIIKDGSLYFGPYTSMYLIKTLLNLFRQLFRLRTCKNKFTPENILKGKYKECLKYHINNCKAPCISGINEEEYTEQITQIENTLRGKFKEVNAYLKKQMNNYAENLEFEKAQDIKKRIELLKNYQSKSTVVNSKLGNLDVFSILSDKKNAYINYLKIVNGSIIQIHNLEIKKRLEEPDKELLLIAIAEIIKNTKLNSGKTEEIIVPFEIDFPLQHIKITIPKIGDKKSLLDLSTKNVKYYRLNVIKQKSLIDPQRHTKRILENMKKELRLKEIPHHIECFDNSNIQGTTPVAACVVFRNGKPYKKEYRKYIIKTVTGPDDFASMEEIIYRRYKRLIKENKKLPQLIIIDGGKGQLHSAVKSLKILNIYGKVAILGIAKKLEEIYFPGDKIPLYIDKKSETLKIIQHARDEAHRFGITFHRDKRSKDFIKSELDNISGIGIKTKEKLLNDFKSVDMISVKNIDDLEKSVGKAKAKLIYQYFNKN